MAFELRADESVRHGLRRLARKELGSTQERIGGDRPPGEDAIHDARKSVKKVRAILELIAADDGHGLDGAKRLLRDVNRMLSCLRDADAMIATLALLQSRHPDLFSEHGYARIRRQLLERRQQAVAEASRATWKELARSLRAVRRAARRWRPDQRGFGALAPGIRATCRRGRHALTRARRTDAADDFHAWRKEMKVLWYALRLIGAGTPAVTRDIRALHNAEHWLGDDHNLAVLCGTLANDPTVCQSPVDVHRLQCAVDAMQRDLRHKAVRRTHAIFAARPREYEARIERAWRMRRGGHANRRPAA
jgi:CHAD domain-containing protein